MLRWFWNWSNSPDKAMSQQPAEDCLHREVGDSSSSLQRIPERSRPLHQPEDVIWHMLVQICLVPACSLWWVLIQVSRADCHCSVLGMHLQQQMQ